MKKLLPIIFLITISCAENGKKEISTQKDSIMKDMPENKGKSMEKVPITSDSSESMINLHESLRSTPINLLSTGNFKLPELMEENGTYKVYSSALEEYLDEVSISPASNSISYTYGDYHIDGIKLNQCKNNRPLVFLLISELMGSYEYYNIIVFEKEGDSKWKEITNSVFDFDQLYSHFEFNQSGIDNAKKYFTFELKDKKLLSAKFNTGKINADMENSTEQNTPLEITEEQKNRKVEYHWSNDKCKFLIQ